MRTVAFAFIGAVLVTGQQCAPSDPGAGPSTLRPPSAVDVLDRDPRGSEHNGNGASTNGAGDEGTQ